MTSVSLNYRLGCLWGALGPAVFRGLLRTGYKHRMSWVSWLVEEGRRKSLDREAYRRDSGPLLSLSPSGRTLAMGSSEHDRSLTPETGQKRASLRC